MIKKYESYEIIRANPNPDDLDKSLWSKIKQGVMMFCGVVAVFFVIALAGIIAVTFALCVFIRLFVKRLQFRRNAASK